ncbi:MAG: diguanylate cyclase [Ramlibacter sp.]|nr:diguanylate cyclase [Ramlibacter sp.]
MPCAKSACPLTRLSCKWLMGLLAWGALWIGAASAQQLPPAEPGGSLLWEAKDWVDPTGTATLQDLLDHPARLAPVVDPGQTYSLGTRGALWRQYHLRRMGGGTSRWRIEFPLPQIDDVTLYEQGPDRRWQARRAGDTVPVNHWSEPGRFPSFSLHGAQDEQVIYVRIAHGNPLAIPVRFVTERDRGQRVLAEYLGQGVLLGVMVLLGVACAGLGWLYSDRVYLWYALQVGVMGLAVAAHSGVAAHFLWPSSGAWADAANGCLPLLSAAMILLLVREVSGIAVHYRRLGWAAVGVGAAGLLVAVVYYFVERRWGLALFGGYILLAIALNLTMAWLTGWRGDVVGHWLFAAYVAPSLSVLVVQLRVHGWLPYGWDTQHLVMGSFLLQGPLLLMALHLRSRDRHQMQVRRQTLVTHDPLTGLLVPHLFQDRLALAIRRARAHGDHAALVVVELANLPSIRKRAGTTQAERSILRCAIKLRGLIKDVDTVCRTGEARFALILEGAHSRQQVSDFGTRLVASGLRSPDGAPQENTLRFHLAACLLGERPQDAAELIPRLEAILEDMPMRSRRVIRFLEPEATVAMPLEPAPGGLHQAVPIR